MHDLHRHIPCDALKSGRLSGLGSKSTRTGSNSLLFKSLLLSSTLSPLALPLPSLTFTYQSLAVSGRNVCSDRHLIHRGSEHYATISTYSSQGSSSLPCPFKGGACSEGSRPWDQSDAMMDALVVCGKQMSYGPYLSRPRLTFVRGTARKVTVLLARHVILTNQSTRFGCAHNG